MAATTIKIFLVYGDPKRLRTAELSNWTGKAVAGPRSEFDDVLNRDESKNPGVYLLTGIEPDTGNVSELESRNMSIKNSGIKSCFSPVKTRT
jgi:hypothetical protein